MWIFDSQDLYYESDLQCFYVYEHLTYDLGKLRSFEYNNIIRNYPSGNLSKEIIGGSEIRVRNRSDYQPFIKTTILGLAIIFYRVL